MSKSIQKLLREALLTEGFSVHRELIQYAGITLNQLADTLFMNYMRHERLVECGVQNLKIQRANDFQFINDFVREFPIATILTPNPIDGDGRKLGHTFSQYRGKIHERSIVIVRITPNQVKELEELMGEMDEWDDQVELKKILHKNYMSVMVHELQHIYDRFISNGKYDSNAKSSEFKKLDDRSKDLYHKGYENLSPEEKVEFRKGETAYLNLPHEINARFIQTLHEIDIEAIPDWSLVYDAFTETFYGWERLSDSDQKRITRRLYKVFQEINN